MIANRKNLSYFMCKEMLYDYVTDNLGDRKQDFMNGLNNHPELEFDIEKLKTAIEFASKLSSFSVESKFIDEITRPSRVKRFCDFLLHIPIWIKAVVLVTILSLGVFIYLQGRVSENLAEVVAQNVGYSTPLVKLQTLNYSLEPNTGDNLTGLIETKLLSLNARPSPEAPLWKRIDEGVLFTFVIDAIDFNVFYEYIVGYGKVTNLDGIEPQSIDQASYNVELTLLLSK